MKDKIKGRIIGYIYIYIFIIIIIVIIKQYTSYKTKKLKAYTYATQTNNIHNDHEHV